MDNAVKARPSHYELLGLAPTASSEEIAQAFAKEVSRPRAFGGLAQLGIAYETLRNPDKRSAYDASIGVAPEPEPQPKAEFKPYAAHAMVARPHFKSEPSAEPRTAAFIASSVRAPEPVPKPEPELEARSQSDLMRRFEAVAMPTFQPTVSPDQFAPAADLEPVREAEDAPVAWRRPAAIAGGLVVAVAAVGALAGLDAGNDAQSALPTAAVTAAVPEAKSVAATATRSAEPALRFGALDVQPQRPSRHAVARRVERAPAAPRAPGLADLQLDSPPSETSAAQTPVEQAAAEPVAPAAVVSASMPLPAATIARTIGRIGYACGRVASTTEIEGEGSGVYKVTCSSGRSYRAAPVRGRYHFRRLSNR